MRDDDEPRDLFEEVEQMQRGVVRRQSRHVDDETKELRRRMVQDNWSHFEGERRRNLDEDVKRRSSR